jgi:hypothetical protein
MLDSIVIPGKDNVIVSPIALREIKRKMIATYIFILQLLTLLIPTPFLPFLPKAALLS